MQTTTGANSHTIIGDNNTVDAKDEGPRPAAPKPASAPDAGKPTPSVGAIRQSTSGIGSPAIIGSGNTVR